jgi:large subunit ribosomal protein L4
MAVTVERRTAAGETAGTVELDESVFGIQPNVPVLHQVVTAQLAAARAGTQSTKTRAEVSGGGKKPFKQKGTGRARQGSERAPHFTGGGVALGPKPRSYRQKTPRKMVQLALRSALSDRAAEGKVAIVDRWPWAEPSTKAAQAALDVLGLDGRVLVVLSREDEDAYKSFRNLTEVQLLLVGELNAYDVLCNDWVVFTSETLPGTAVSGPAAASSGQNPASSGEDTADSVAAPADVQPVGDVEPATEPATEEEEEEGDQ